MLHLSCTGAAKELEQEKHPEASRAGYGFPNTWQSAVLNACTLYFSTGATDALGVGCL